MVCTLSGFDCCLPCNEVPLCEIEGQLYYAPNDEENLSLFTSSVSSLPAIVINKDVHPSTPKSQNNRVFLPVTETLTQRLQNAWYEGGVVDILEILADPCEHNVAVGHYVAKSLLYCNKLLGKLKAGFNKKPDSVASFKKYLGNGAVICFAWHPHCTKIAIATRDDSVSIYSSYGSLVPVLKAKSQRDITAIAWRPLTSCEIAVACSEGVYIWSLDPNSVICRPSASSANFLQVENHRNVLTLAWSPNGDVLATGSAEDNTVYLWQVDMKSYIPLKRVGQGGISLLSWSPDNSKLIAATTTTTFRIWKTEWWEAEAWNTIGGDVVATAWSPLHYGILLFATRTEPFLYAMPSSTPNLYPALDAQARTASLVIADFSPVQIPSGECVGGEVMSLTWDNKGRHLAVLFKDSDLIVVFITTLQPQLRLATGFLIKGRPCEIPSVITFQNDFKEGANLTIAWNNGRVQYFPIIYKDSEPVVAGPNLTGQGQVDKTLLYFSFTSP